ncbi:MULTISPECIES: hypothetical protein [Solibacillus]|uniref:Uncharacterized protein n=1 Tax=Solibacillus merdavium TaxID=2762218 RepID=A0ABR8XLM4_9BACL|nr:hypothetical protein [Solibacillus merdavium]MBD8032839.1 hypothetical protein [Solibacillus merdavium]
MCLIFTVIGCSEQEEAKTGEFLIGNFGFELISKETYHLVVPFEWTGESSVTIDSIELIKRTVLNDIVENGVIQPTFDALYS